MDLRMTTIAVTLTVLVIMSSVHSVYSQAYHFSNGWFPGRKRSIDVYSSSPYRMDSALKSSVKECQIRPQVEQLVTDLIQTELVRIVNECHLVSDSMPSVRSQELTAWLQNIRHREDSDALKNI